MKNKPKHAFKKCTTTKSIYRILFSLLLAFGLTFTACKGPAGPQGQRGKVGPAGDNGSILYAGKGAPADNIGKTGDYYLDTNTGAFYGPKSSKGWENNPIIVLMGEQGLRGPKGDQGPKDPKVTKASRVKMAAKCMPAAVRLLHLREKQATTTWTKPVLTFTAPKKAADGERPLTSKEPMVMPM